MGAAGLKQYARLAIFLAIAGAAQFCLLNPQPEPPPADHTRCPPCLAGGAGGATGGGGTAGTGGTGAPPPINPENPDGGRGTDAATGDAASDPATDAGLPDGEDDATEGGGDEPDSADDAGDVPGDDDAGDAAIDHVPDGEIDASRTTPSRTAVMLKTARFNAVAGGDEAPPGAAQPWPMC